MEGWFQSRSKILLFALLTLLLKIPNAYGLASVGIAKMPGAEAEQDLAEQLSQALTGRITQIGWYKLADQGELANSLQQANNCDDIKCLVRIGLELKLDKLALVSAKNTEGKYELAIRVININRAEEEAKRQAECQNDSPSKDCLSSLVDDTLKGLSVQADVTQADNEQVTINFGRNVALSAGRTLKIMRIKRVTASGRTFYTGEKILGEARIQSVGEHESQLKVLKSFLPIKAGDLAMLSGLVPGKSSEEKTEPAAAPVEPAKTEAAPEGQTGGEQSDNPQWYPNMLRSEAFELVKPAKIEETVPAPVAEAAPVEKPAAEQVKEAEFPAQIALPNVPELQPAPRVAAAEPPDEPETAPSVSEAVKTEKPAAQKAPEKPVVQEAAKDGILNIVSAPTGAEIFLNGESVGNTPKLIPSLPPGEYKVRLKKEFYEDWQGQTNIMAGQATKLEIALKENAGKLTITSIPSEAEISVDGKASGKTNATLKLLPAQYTVTVGKKGYRKETLTVQVNNGMVQVVDFILLKDEHVQIPDMVYVPEGSFRMGYAGGSSDESPVHEVYLDAFYIDRYAVSNRDYQKFLKETKREPPNFWTDTDLNKPDLPVVGETWADAQAYCKWAGKRLPTEAQWEKAARGVDGRLYPWGNTFDAHRANAYGEQDGYKFTAPVNSLSGGQSIFGAFHMSGNVWQWCSDWYDPDYYRKSPARNPMGSAEGEFRVIRGDAWDESNTANLRVTHRSAKAPNNSTYNIGFRCVK